MPDARTQLPASSSQLAVDYVPQGGNLGGCGAVRHIDELHLLASAVLPASSADNDADAAGQTSKHSNTQTRKELSECSSNKLLQPDSR